jgi:RND superfamily putative drug exporter
MFSTMLLMRTREEYVADGTGRQAVRTGLRETAAAGTGAGIVMLAAVIPFATTDLINVRELGVGVAVAIALDVVIVRPVLLPAAEAVLGRLGWWPTAAPRDSEAPTSAGKASRLPRPHLPQPGPRAAH